MQNLKSDGYIEKANESVYDSKHEWYLKFEIELLKLQDVMAKTRSYSGLFLKRGFVCIVS